MITLKKLPLPAALGPLFLLTGCPVVQAEQTPPAMNTPLPRTPFASDRLSVEVFGTGPDVVLLPGFACSREIWRPLANRLAPKYRVHLVQYAGFAGEPWRPGQGPYVQPLANELERYLRENKIEKPALIGHSMGGMLALLLAQHNPETIGRVLCVDSLPYFPLSLGRDMTPEVVRRYADQVAAASITMDDARFYTSQVAGATAMVRDPEMQSTLADWAVACDRFAFASALRDLITLDLRPGLPAMTTPVWLAYAADAKSGNAPDKATATWKQAYATLPNAKFVLVDNSRHFIMVDQKEKLNEVVEDFLKETDRG